MRLIIGILMVFLYLSCSETGGTDGSKDEVERLFLKADLLDGEDQFATLKRAYELVAILPAADSTKSKKLFDLASRFYKIDSLYYFKKCTYKAYDEAFEKRDTATIVKSALYLGIYYGSTEHLDSSYYYYTRAEKLALPVNDSVSLAAIFINKAFLQVRKSDFFGAELSASKALNFVENRPDKRKKYDAFNIIGVCASEMQNYNRAIDYYNRALEVTKEPELVDHQHLSANTLNNIGVVFQDKNDHKTAINYFKAALLEKDLLADSPSLYAILLDNLGYSQFKIGQRDGVEAMLLRALKLREKLELHSGIVVNQIHLSEYYQTIGDYPKAMQYAKSALSISQRSNVAADLLGSLKQIASVDRENEAKYSKMYIRINDSVQQEERRIQEKFGRIQFETNEILQESEKLAEQNRNLLYFFVAFFMIGSLLFVIRNQRAKNRELMLKQAQQKANEEIYNLIINQQTAIEESRSKEKKRIAQELHDGVLGRLFGTRLNLDSLNRLTDEEAVNRRVEYISELKNIEEDIREISHDLNREKFVIINNFIAILNKLVTEQEDSFDTRVQLEVDNKINWDGLPNTFKINIYRIVQECFQNINKYAKATVISVTIRQNDSKITIAISDNGVGFDVGVKKKGIGLQNMLSRANEMDGTLDVRSKKGKGTIVTAIFPLK